MKKKIYILILFLSILDSNVFAHNIKVDTLSTHAVRIMRQLNAALLNYVHNDKQSPDFGAVYCPQCRLFHTRAAESVFPFAFEYKLTGNASYLRAAINVGNWLIRQQQDNGAWLETPETWTGTTTDQALMMALSYPILKDYFTEKDSKLWLKAIEKAGNYLVDVMSPEFASINYCATTTATLMSIYSLIKKNIYINKARKLAYQVIAKMDHDYFLTGEGGRVFGVKYGVDLGYNLEMSLWGLALYSLWADDLIVKEYVEKSLHNHLGFIYPDGSMDGSWGIRSNKWTCFGSGTSDGCQILFSLFLDKNDQYRTAAIRNMQFLEKCMKNGIVGFGPLYYDIFDNIPCIYPTFAKAKNLAMAIYFVKADIGELQPLPLDYNGICYYPTLNVATVRTDEWCGTVSSYTYKDPAKEKSKYMHRPTGGSICNLWLKDHGYFQASSQTIYKRWEPMSFPEMEETLPLTPRIEFRNDKGYFTNLYEFDASMSCQQKVNQYIITSIGELKNEKQQEGGVSYYLSHEISNSSIIKKFELIYHDAYDQIFIVEPIIEYPNMRFEKVDNKTLRINMTEKCVELTIHTNNIELELGHDSQKYRFPYPALKAYPIILKVINNNELRQTVEIHYNIVE